jgi:uncharacterized protein YegL
MVSRVQNWLSSHLQASINGFSSVRENLLHRLPEIFNIAKKFNENFYINIIKEAAWKHRKWIAGGFILTCCLSALKNWLNRQPIPPCVSMESSLNVARISIEIPKEERRPPNVSLTFCIDTSSSMNGEREKAVKQGIQNVLDTTERTIEENPTARIEMAIVGFDKIARVISKPSKLDNKESIKKVRESVTSFSSNGCTSILNGLNLATSQLEEIAKKNPEGTHVFILLTDGEDSTLNSSNMQAIHSKLKGLKARLFAIGIQGHNQSTLKLVAPDKGLYTGTYIDASQDTQIITKTITQIFYQTIASYMLEIRSKQLKVATWSLSGKASIEDTEGQSKCLIETLPEGSKVVKRIRIHTKKLEKPLDLSQIQFELIYTDLKGRQGSLSLPWNPNFILDPAIIHNIK